MPTGSFSLVLQNTLLLAVARIVSKMATLFIVIVVARRLGTADFGLFSTLTALSVFGGLLSDFGLVLPSIRSMSRTPGEEHRIFSRTLSARLVWSSVALAMMLGVAGTFDYPFIALMLFAVSSVLEALFTALIRSFESRQDMVSITKFVLLERLSFGMFVAGALWFQPNLTAVAAATVISYTGMTLLSAIAFQRSFGPFAMTVTRIDLKAATKTGFPFLLSALMSAAYYKGDLILLERLRTANEAGLYSAAGRIVEALMFIPLSLMNSIFPVLSRIVTENPERLRGVIVRVGGLFVFLGVGVGAGIILLAPEIISVLYAEDFSSSAPLLQILGLMILPYFVNFYLSQTLVAINQEWFFTVVMGVAAMALFVANAIVIPEYGAQGASWTRVATEGGITLAFLAGVITKLGQAVNIRHESSGKAP